MLKNCLVLQTIKMTSINCVTPWWFSGRASVSGAGRREIDRRSVHTKDFKMEEMTALLDVRGCGVNKY